MEHLAFGLLRHEMEACILSVAVLEKENTE